MSNNMQDFLDAVPAPKSSNKEANAAVTTFREGLQNIADSEAKGQAELQKVADSVTPHDPPAVVHSVSHKPWGN